uniref:Pyridoxal-dependent decarboxylase domain-containing protein 1 n=1 Tax=Hucho hucho TaxID=62062 RepID=A0A4W5RT17_9TELE
FHKQMMVDPTLAEMGKNLNEAMKILEDGRKASEPDADRRQFSRSSIPGPLQGDGQDVASILQLVQNLMHEDEEEDKPSHRMQNVGEQGHMALLGHSLAAYISVLDRERLRKLITRIASDTTLWLCRLFRYESGSAYYHEDDREGLLKVCRLVINTRYEDYSTEGYTVLNSRQPVIYQSATCRPGLGQHLCSQLGLPLSSLCTVPCNTMFGSQHQMDIALLDKLIREDVETGKLPLLLIANAGTPGAGHTDKLGRLKELCEQYGMWLHIEGWVTTLHILAATRSDSMTLTLGPWLGLPAVPAVTLYRHEDPALSLAAGLTSSQPVEKLRALPLWLSLQYLGHDGIVEKIRHAVELSQQLLEKLKTLASIKTSVEDELNSPVVVFRFSQETSLCERLAQLVPASGVDIVELEDEGTCVRFTPLMTAAALGTQRCDVDLLVERLTELVPVLNCTLRLRLDFREEVYRHSEYTVTHSLLVSLFGPEKDCIFIGMGTEDLDVAELVDTIAALGRDIEENGRVTALYTCTFYGLILYFIFFAPSSLSLSLSQGVLRQIPLVGSVLNWFSPFQSTVKGRTFNLAAGSLDSTEPTYSMKAQTGGLASPETPTSSAKRLLGQRLFRREGAGGSDSHSETSSVGQAEDLSRERVSQPTTPTPPVPDEVVAVAPESPETPQVPAEPEPTQEKGEVGTQEGEEEESQPEGQEAPVEETGR